MKRFLLALLALFSSAVLYSEELIYRIGKGTLEESAQGTILRLEGKPYERGVQHGTLLKEKIQANVEGFIDVPGLDQSPRVKAFHAHLSTLLSSIPSHYLEEMRGVAYGADVPFEKILMLNLFPEMFHCIGITVQNEATFDHSLYHVRVLDYGAIQGLQHSAILMVVKPEDKHAFVSVGYAGFIGSVTGMNEKKIAMGEIGGDGYGYWNGIPMAFLIREVLEKSGTLEEAKELLKSSPRTCEYYYVLSDGNQEKAVGVYATASQIQFIEPGSSYALMAPHGLPKNYGENGVDDKFFMSSFAPSQSEFQFRVHNEAGNLIALFNHQPEHCIVLRGFGYPERYTIVAERIRDLYGKIDAEHLQDIIKAPATNETNLHNAIFRPSTLDLWVSHAGIDGTPASELPYGSYHLPDLLNP
jgi:hypothetical protein